MKKIKIYCEDGAMTKDIRMLKNSGSIELISFPFENFNRRTTDSKLPSNLTIDSTFITADSDIKISDTVSSDIFDKIANIIGKENNNDIRHVDTAYKEKCQIFVSPDKKDIINKGKELEELTGIKFFHCDDFSSIKKFLESCHSSTI
ncbi:hypothetical protein [Aquimarina megaterium]|uniref:hypothetical protein n=1 Tax=Aquimarina megaterium TaxID=1443666 RepID=UPI001111A806|nr:hypothetical protein [Aquimarina megaterium]